jgi:urease accessory protein
MTSLKLSALCVVGALIITLSLVAMPVLAHSGSGGGLALGFMHPILGLDHVLTMLTVGLFANQLGGRGLWMVPSSFVLVMALGGGLGVSAIELPLAEIGIALSVVVLGTAVALRLRPPLALAMGLFGLFALFHGHTHGSEMPASVSVLAYGAGILVATAVLHTVGISLGSLASRLGSERGMVVVRATGAAIAAAGLVILGVA